MPAISAVIIARNEAGRIGACLASLQGVADEVLVLDSGSSDGTQALCRQWGATVVEPGWKGYSENKNLGIGMAVHPWVLSIDADESLSPELREAILSAKPALQGAYRFNRLTRYCGRWIRHGGWYPDAKIRLFPKASARWEGEVHEHLVLAPGTGITPLPGDLLHDSIRNTNEHLQRAVHYAGLAAEAMHRAGKKAGWFQLRLAPALRFLRMYVLKTGFMDGWQGYQLCRISAQSLFWRYAMLRELHQGAAGTAHSNNTQPAGKDALPGRG